MQNTRLWDCEHDWCSWKNSLVLGICCMRSRSEVFLHLVNNWVTEHHGWRVCDIALCNGEWRTQIALGITFFCCLSSNQQFHVWDLRTVHWCSTVLFAHSLWPISRTEIVVGFYLFTYLIFFCDHTHPCLFFPERDFMVFTNCLLPILLAIRKFTGSSI